jgi:putative tryptophan/tyrosine transport system substrate-binding protein
MRARAVALVLLGLIVLAALAIFLARAQAQQPGKVHRLAIIYPAGTVEQMTEPILLPELGRLGYVEGKNLVVERRSGGGRRESYPDVAREVVALKPDVIFAASGRMAEACRSITSTIPIVTITSDPVALGLAASLSRPGGNITGFTVDAGLEVVGKRLELLKEVAPNASRVAFLATQQAWDGKWGLVMREAAERAGVASIAATVGDPIREPEYRRAFAVVAKERGQALVVTDHAEGFANRRLIVELAAQGRLPAIYAYREFVEAGGLMAYAFDRGDMRRRVANYIDRILKGARPADLPFQQPTKFDLVINLKTAKALGLTIPPNLLLRADQVIE